MNTQKNKSERGMPFNLVFEEFLPSSKYSNLKILQEMKSENGETRVKFRSPVQDAETVNQNRRFYSKETCNAIVEGLLPKARNNCLLSELGHPNQEGDQESIKRRAVVVDINNCGSMITDLRMEGNNIVADMVTLSGFKGPDLKSLIVEDKVNLGFSLRMFSQVRPSARYENVVEVISPLKPITYDIVSDPSHRVARLTSFVTESSSFRSLLNSEAEDQNLLLTEANEILLNDGIKHPETSQKIIAEYLNQLVREAYYDLRKITFKVG